MLFYGIQSRLVVINGIRGFLNISGHLRSQVKTVDMLKPIT